MITVHKFPLLESISKIEMPLGARVLTVEAQHERPCLWALVDTEMPMEKRTFRIAGTGHAIDHIKSVNGSLNYVGSFILEEGTFVFHVFEIPTPA